MKPSPLLLYQQETVIQIPSLYIFLLVERAGHRPMWNSTNYFLVNLSVVDLLMTVLNTLFNFFSFRDR